MGVRLWILSTWTLWLCLATTAQDNICNNGTLVRLVQTPSLLSNNTGRLEICINGVWGTVSSTSRFWPQKNSLVACQALGFPSALNSVPTIGLRATDLAGADVPVHMEGVGCTGTEETLLGCHHRQLTDSFSHGDDVYIVCLPGPQSYSYSGLHTAFSEKRDLRLKGSVINGRGVVEIERTSGIWETICPDSGWRDSSATVICQNLGYESGQAITVHIAADLVGDQVLYDTECEETGSSAIFRISAGGCSFQTQSPSSCSEDGFAGVSCSSNSTTGAARLFAQTVDEERNRVEGIVEVFVDSRWGLVCAPILAPENVAEATCEGLGYSRDNPAITNFPPSSIQAMESQLKPIWYPDIACSVEAKSLSECTPGAPVGYGTCSLLFTIQCSDPPFMLSSGAIAGIVIPCLLLVAFILWCFLHFKPQVWDKRHGADWYKKITSVRQRFTINTRTTATTTATTTTRPVTTARQSTPPPVHAPSPTPAPAPTPPPPASAEAAASRNEKKPDPNPGIETAPEPPSAPPLGELPPPYPGPPPGGAAYLAYPGGYNPSAPPPPPQQEQDLPKKVPLPRAQNPAYPPPPAMGGAYPPASQAYPPPTFPGQTNPYAPAAALPYPTN